MPERVWLYVVVGAVVVIIVALLLGRNLKGIYGKFRVETGRGGASKDVRIGSTWGSTVEGINYTSDAPGSGGLDLTGSLGSSVSNVSVNIGTPRESRSGPPNPGADPSTH
jgi:hypothetical protein